MNKRNDLITGIVLIAFSLVYLVQAFNIRIFKAMGKAVVNSTTMPKIWAICMILLALSLIVRAIRSKNDGDKNKTRSFKQMLHDNSEVIATFTALVIYIAIMELFGFIFASILYIFAQTIILTPKDKRNYVQAGIIAVICSVATYYLFVSYLSVLLPEGILLESVL